MTLARRLLAIAASWRRTRARDTTEQVPHRRRADALAEIAFVQGEGGAAAYIDAAHALDADDARMAGIDLQMLVFAQPASREEALEICLSLLESHSVRLVVLDSFVALPPLDVLTGEWEDSSIRANEQWLQKAMRTLCRTTRRTAVRCLFAA